VWLVVVVRNSITRVSEIGIATNPSGTIRSAGGTRANEKQGTKRMGGGGNNQRSTAESELID
jgi:hypothetical protein